MTTSNHNHTGTNKTAPRAGNGDRSYHFRSRVTAGLDLLPGIDGRCTAARVMRSTYITLVNHCGGEDVPETLRLMCRRAAAIEAECINLETKFAHQREAGGHPGVKDLDLYTRLVNTQRRVCDALGWTRRMRDITPTLGSILKAGLSREADDVEECEEEDA